MCVYVCVYTRGVIFHDDRGRDDFRGKTWRKRLCVVRFAEGIVENIDFEQYMCYWVLKDTSVDTEETGGACTCLVP
jgi:hypothetical protein